LTLVPHDLVTEYWGAGRFLGVYPTRERIGVIAAGPAGTMGPAHAQGRRARTLETFAALEGRGGDIINSLPDDDEELFFWRLADQRTKTWIKGRVALIGDSACAFLPTAGIGASMAMESAAVLADELSRTDAGMPGHALDFYEKRRKSRVEAAQADSRKLAKMIFVESTPLAWSRDQLLKFYTLEQLAKSIAKILDQPI
jgi:2-polyprenyl-6-methoxyphenol hydroxylase-like FAD-dependent oxidoreductase